MAQEVVSSRLITRPKTPSGRVGLVHFDWRGDVRRYRSTKEKYEPENRDINIGWEASGMSGRVWYTYKADTVNQVLYLQNKNKADRKQKQELHYVQTSDSRVILYGTNEFGDSIYAVLDRAEEDYPLHAKND